MFRAACYEQAARFEGELRGTMEITTFGKLFQEIGISGFLIVSIMFVAVLLFKWMFNYLNEQQKNYKEDKNQLMGLVIQQQKANEDFLQRFNDLAAMMAESKLAHQYQRQEHEQLLMAVKGIKTRG